MSQIIYLNEFKARVLNKIAKYKDNPWWFYYEPSNALTRLILEGAEMGYQPAMQFVNEYLDLSPILNDIGHHPQGSLTIQDVLASHYAPA